MSWQSVGLGLMQEFHDTLGSSAEDTRMQAMREENESLRSRIAELETSASASRNREEEMECQSAVALSKLEKDLTGTRKQLQEAHNNSKVAELQHKEHLTKLQSEKEEALRSSSELQLQKQALQDKCHDLEVSNTKLRENLRASMEKQVPDASSRFSDLEKQLAEASSRIQAASEQRVKVEESLNQKVDELSRDNSFLAQEKARLEGEVQAKDQLLSDAKKKTDEARKDLRELIDGYDSANHHAFVACVQQLLFLNPGITLNLKGLSANHAMKNGVLIDIPKMQPVNIDDPELPTFNPSDVTPSAAHRVTDSSPRDV